MQWKNAIHSESLHISCLGIDTKYILAEASGC